MAASTAADATALDMATTSTTDHDDNSSVQSIPANAAAIPANARGKLTPIQLRNRLAAYLRGGQEKEAALARLLREVNE